MASQNGFGNDNETKSDNEKNTDNTTASGNAFGNGNALGSDNTTASGNSADIGVDLLSSNEIGANNVTGSNNVLGSDNDARFDLDVEASERVTTVTDRKVGLENIVTASGASAVTIDDIDATIDALKGAGNDSASAISNVNMLDDSDQVSDVEMEIGGVKVEFDEELVDIDIDVDQDADSEADNAFEVSAEADADAENEAEADADADAEVKSFSKDDLDADAEAEADAEADADGDADAKAVTVAKGEAEADADAENDIEIENTIEIDLAGGKLGFQQDVTATAANARLDDGIDGGVFNGSIGGAEAEAQTDVLSDVIGDARFGVTNAATSQAAAGVDGVRQDLATGGTTMLNEAASDVVGGAERVTVAGDTIAMGTVAAPAAAEESAELDQFNGNEVASGNEKTVGNDFASSNSVGSDNTVGSENTALSGNVTGSGNTTNSGNTTASNNVAASDNSAFSGNTTASDNAFSLDKDIASDNEILSGNETLSGNRVLSGNDTSTDVSVDLSKVETLDSVEEIGASGLVNASHDSHVTVDDLFIDYGRLAGAGNDTAFDLEQINELNDTDTVSDISLEMTGGFSQNVNVMAGAASAEDGLDEGIANGRLHGGESQASLLSDVVGNASLNVENIATSDALAQVDGVTQSISTGGNVLANSFEQTLVGGDSTLSQTGDDILA